MYQTHPSFRTSSDDTVLWRYMDFVKFVSLIDRKALFFVKISQLGDPFEGSITEYTKAEIQQWNLVNPWDVHKTIQDSRDQMLISCWHKNEYESAAMWNLYGQHIAVRTTFGRLCNSFVCDEDIYIGDVSYADYENAHISLENLFNLYLHKRRSFEHEKEVRAIAKADPMHVDLSASGYYYSVNVETLIECVVIAPHVDDWFIDLVRSTSQRYDLDFPVKKSDLKIAPLF